MPWSSDAVLEDGWKEVTRAFPQLRDAVIVDQYIQRNDLAIARRPKGYLKALKRFRDLGPLQRVTFAGDYLVNSTVGQAHWFAIGSRFSHAIHPGVAHKLATENLTRRFSAAFDSPARARIARVCSIPWAIRAADLTSALAGN